MVLVKAPNKISLADYSERIFLAGGITKCNDWQKEVTDYLHDKLVVEGWDTGELAIFNPRRDDFPMDDSREARKQIEWEFKYLEQCNIFTVYFCNSESVQPICMYELGRNLVRMKDKFQNSWKQRVIVSIEDGYKRAQDVIIQCQLAGLMVNEHATPYIHAQAIANAWSVLYC